MQNRRFDVAILGSGFGASLLGTILAKCGKSVAIIDRSTHPRFAIGESSTPIADKLLLHLSETYGIPEIKPIARFGDWRAAYPDHNCGCKRGFTYFWHGEGNEFEAGADHRHELFVTANSSEEVADTQWYRPQLDHFLMNLAQEYGVTAFEETAVNTIERVTLNQWKLDITSVDGESQVDAGFIVDASGAQSILLDMLNIPDITSELQTRSHAVYSHWRDCLEVSQWCDKTATQTSDFPYAPDQSVVHHLFDDGWLWQIRFADGLTSVGFVSAGSPEQHPQTAERQWDEICSNHPVIQDILGAPILADFPNRIFKTERIQRLRSRAADSDWAALPFTAGFVDPLHSTGIAQTLSAVKRLSKIILGEDHARSLALEQYSHDVVNEIRHIDHLVYGCYLGLNDFEIFTTWAMVYFAAATTYERHMNSPEGKDVGFLCSNDEGFRSMTTRLLDQLRSCIDTPDAQTRESWIQDVKISLEPYNHVGLFNPAVANMYTHTSAPK